MGVRRDLSKAAQQFRFETRRREIDQGHKLTAAIDDIIGRQSGAIAAEWISSWRRMNYDYRKDHKDRDEKVYAIRGNWAIEKGLMNKGDGYTDEMTMPGEEVSCQCRYKYINSLSQLPESMLTKKGKEHIEQVRLKIAV